VADEYNIVLTLTDGNFGNVISQSMLILVEDINDHGPVFEPHPSTVTVPENSRPTVLAHFRATDQDEGLFGQVNSQPIYFFYSVFFSSSQSMHSLLISLDSAHNPKIKKEEEEEETKRKRKNEKHNKPKTKLHKENSNKDN
jgi:hypothetical protein